MIKASPPFLIIILAAFCTAASFGPGDLSAESAWVDVREHKGDFSAAVNASRGRKVMISSPTKTIPGSLSTPTDVQIEVVQGGMIVTSPSAAVTINGPFSAGLHQVFRGGGAVTFGAGSSKEVYPEWWGTSGTNDENAINAAVNSISAGDVVLSRTYYIDTAPVTMKSGITLRGRGRADFFISSKGPILYTRRARGGAVFIGEHVSGISIENIGFRAAATTSGQYGIEMAGDYPNSSFNMSITRNSFYRLDKGIYVRRMTPAAGEWQCDHVEINQNTFNECNIDIHLASQNTDYWKISNNAMNYLDTGVYLDRSGIVTLDTNAGAGVGGVAGSTFIKANVYGPLTMINNQAEQTDWFFRYIAGSNPYPINLIGNTANAPCKVDGNVNINSIGNYYSYDFMLDAGNANVTSSQDRFDTGKKFIPAFYSQIASATTGPNVKYRITADDDQSAASVREMPITTTGDTTVVSLKPWNVAGVNLLMYKIHYYYRVVKAATTVRIHLDYNDAAGHQDIDLVPSGSKQVGSYLGADVTVGATSGTGTKTGIALRITAGTANQVYISATIEPITY